MPPASLATGGDDARRSPAVERWASRLLEDRRVAWALMLAYVAAGLYFIYTDRALNDEGLLTHYWADWARRALLPTVFFQKSKPVLCVLYLPFTVGGVRATLVAHLLAASLVVPLLRATSVALGLSAPNLAPFIAALSPLYFIGGAAGISNVDAVLAISLVVYLLATRRNDWLVGLVIGTIPWVRHELALFSGLLFLRALFVARSHRQALGAMVFPLAYAAAGALYQRDLLWMVHFPPQTPSMPGNPIWAYVSAGAAFASLVSVTPVIGLALTARPREMRPLEREMLLYALTWLTLCTVLPLWRIANFGFVPRYSLPVLPLLALLAARAVERWRRPDLRLEALDLAAPGLLLALWLAAACEEPAVAVPVLLGQAAALALASRRRFAPAALAVLALCGLGLLLPIREQVASGQLAPYLAGMVGWIEGHRAEIRGPVYTNSPLLGPHLERPLHRVDVDVRFMIGVDQHHDLALMTNAANGQRETLLGLMTTDLYGHGVAPGVLNPASLPDGTLFMLRRDRRITLLMPSRTWARHLTSLLEAREFQVLRFTRAPRP